jgi:hypothetical protein
MVFNIFRIEIIAGKAQAAMVLWSGTRHSETVFWQVCM